MTSAPLFSWLAGTPAYRDAHVAAVAVVPAGSPGDRWVDVGCGPGLITVAAAQHGYDALGIDLDSVMIVAARASARRQRASAAFRVGDVMRMHVEPASVVSAASLLMVVPDPRAALDRLWQTVAPGGTLLIVETTAAMTPDAVRAYEATVPDLRSRTALRMWANARRGRALDPAMTYALAGATLERIPLIGDMLEVWKLTKS